MLLEKCEKCGEFIFSWKKHKCDPVFEVFDEEYDNEWIDCRGFDHQDAAINYAEKCNTLGDYALMDKEKEIKVRDPREGIVKSFVISAKPDFYYDAIEVTQKIRSDL